jgi:FecR protein
MTLFVAKQHILSRFIVGALALAFAGSLNLAHAEEQVGVAVTVRNDVTGKLQSSVVRVSDGSSVYGREVVKTSADSSAKLVLKDNTNLNVGPNSSVSLDNFVFAGNSDYKQAGFNLAKGAFRFTSGASDKRSYDLKTPVATIGVRGTDFVVIVTDEIVQQNKVRVSRKRSHIEVSNGLTLVCPAKATSKEAVTLDLEKKKRCERDEPNNKSCGCTKKCSEVASGAAVDVSEEYVCSADFTGVQVGNDPVSFAEATTPALDMGAVAMGAMGAAAAAGGTVAATNNNGSAPPILPPITTGVSK